MIDAHISDYDGNTILVGGDDNDYIFISGHEIIKMSTEDKIIDFMSLMRNIMIPTAVAVGEKYKNFISDHYKFNENEKTEDGTLLN